MCGEGGRGLVRAGACVSVSVYVFPHKNVASSLLELFLLLHAFLLCFFLIK